jgi:hypothetical protein
MKKVAFLTLIGTALLALAVAGWIVAALTLPGRRVRAA